MQSILIIDTPKNCPDCQLMADGWCYGIPSREEVQGKIKYLKRPSWCPLRHPLKAVSNDFYIYDRKYLLDNLDREIDLLKGAKAFEEFMKAREEE